MSNYYSYQFVHLEMRLVRVSFNDKCHAMTVSCLHNIIISFAMTIKNQNKPHHLTSLCVESKF